MAQSKFTGTIEFDNEDGTVDKFKYKDGQIIEATFNIKKRKV